MKILYDCFSCSPYYGSDEGIGWLWPYYMRKYHEVWALVRKDRKNDIERYCLDNNIKDIHFIYADIPDWINLYYRNKSKGKNGVLDFLAYQFLWQFPAYYEAKKVHKNVHFDLIHHVGTNDFRFLGKLYKLNIPFIIGPIGGAQETPKQLEYYIRNHKQSEQFRKIINKLFTSMPGYKRALNKARYIFFSNDETRDYLLPKIRSKNKCKILTEVGWDYVTDLSDHKYNEMQEIIILWAGRMEYRKGLELLFDVLDRLSETDKWKLLLCGDGSEKSFYEKIISTKTYRNQVKFLGKISYEQMKEVYKMANIFVFPSLRETTGTVIIEAMANGLPVIALRQGGAKYVITNETGDLVTGNSQEEILSNFCTCINMYIKKPNKTVEKGKLAQKRILDNYTWEKKTQIMNTLYNNID